MSMEYHGILWILRGIPFNSMEHHGCMSKCFTDYHGIPSVFHVIPVKTMEYHRQTMEIPWDFSIRRNNLFFMTVNQLGQDSLKVQVEIC
jgi:hypothetical protein